MRKLGLIGGMSWVSTHRYFERISAIVRKQVDPRASPPMAIESIDFHDIYRLQDQSEWDAATERVVGAAKRLEASGAQMLLIGANGMHKIFKQVTDSVDLPFLHIAECVGKRMAAANVRRASLLGTRGVMTESFYRRQLVAHGIDLLPPEMDDVDALENIIFEELMVGKTRRDSERAMKTMINDAQKEGADAVVLACAELEMIVDVDANIVPVYDAMRIHAEDAAQWIIGDE